MSEKFAVRDHTFVVPAYGESPFIGACLRSLQSQSIPSRILITTSTPSDYLQKVADEFRVPLMVRDGSPSIGADWNFALKSASTDYVTIAHQDDTYDSPFAQSTLAALNEQPRAGLCFTGYREIDENDRVVSRGLVAVKEILLALFGRGRPIAGTSQRLLLSFGCPIPCPAVTFKKNVLPSDFGFSPQFAVNLDWDAWWRLQESQKPFARVPKQLMSHRIHSTATTSQAKRDGRRAIEDDLMFRRAWPGWAASALAAVYRLGY